MPRNRKLIIAISMLLIPVLLGMTPMNLFQKLSGQYNNCQSKQIQKSGSCLFNSLISQDNNTTPILNSTMVVEQINPSYILQTSVLDASRNSSYLSSVPLRC